jgi:P27 family predicted phage terminase small subunit
VEVLAQRKDRPVKPGPKPRPHALRVLSGETRPSRVGNPPTGQAGDPQRPAWFTGEQAEAWDAIIDELPPGVVTRSDSSVVRIAAESLVMLRQLSEITTQVGPLIKGRRDGLVNNPAWSMWRRQAELTRRLLAELGMTPSSRAALRFGMDPYDDAELEALLS